MKQSTSQEYNIGSLRATASIINKQDSNACSASKHATNVHHGGCCAACCAFRRRSESVFVSLPRTGPARHARDCGW